MTPVDTKPWPDAWPFCAKSMGVYVLPEGSMGLAPLIEGRCVTAQSWDGSEGGNVGILIPQLTSLKNFGAAPVACTV
jgi:hypothetical protein